MKLNFDNILKFSEEEHKYTAKINNVETVGVSTTTILGETGVAPDFSKGNQALISFRAKRGTRVHLAIEYKNKGILDRDSLLEEDLPFFESYEKFQEEYGWMSILQESKFAVLDFDIDDDKKYVDNFSGSKEELQKEMQAQRRIRTGMIDGIYKIPKGQYVFSGKTVNVGENAIAIIDYKTSAKLTQHYDFQVGGGYYEGVTQGRYGNDLGKTFMQLFEETGITVEEIHCFVLQLKQNDFMLRHVDHEVAFPIWKDIVRKFYNPKAKINLTKIIKNQIDLPQEQVAKFIEYYEQEKIYKSQKEGLKRDFETLLKKDGLVFNGTCQLDDGTIFQYNMTKGEFSESYDKQAFIDDILNLEDGYYSAKDFRELWSSHKVSKEKSGYYRMSIKKPKISKEDVKEKDSRREKEERDFAMADLRVAISEMSPEDNTTSLISHIADIRFKKLAKELTLQEIKILIEQAESLNVGEKLKVIER